MAAEIQVNKLVITYSVLYYILSATKLIKFVVSMCSVPGTNLEEIPTPGAKIYTGLHVKCPKCTSFIELGVPYM